jgi:hypothetical protein
MPIITEYSLEGATSRNEFFIKPTFTKIAFMYLKLAVMIPVVSKN